MPFKKFEQGRFVLTRTDIPLVFIHINKTAGTSFGDSLRGLFKDENISPPYRGDFSTMNLHDRKIRLFHGHMLSSRWLANDIPGHMICMLRNPLERVKSQYKSFKSIRNTADAALWVDSKNSKEALEIARSASFDEFLLSENNQIRGHLDNLQVQFISNDGGSRGYSSVKSAIENLEKNFFFFGITEEYRESLRLLSWQLGQEVAYGKRLNASASDIIEAKSEAAKTALDSYIYWDNFLYEAAREIFRARMNEFELLNPEPVYGKFG